MGSYSLRSPGVRSSPKAFVFLQKQGREAFQKHGSSATLRPMREILRACES